MYYLVNLVDLVKSFPTNIYLQNLASIQKRTSPVKFAHLAEKSGKGSISNLSTKVPAGLLTLAGPVVRDYGCTLGIACFLSLRGVGVGPGNGVKITASNSTCRTAVAVTWAANKRFEILKFKFKFPIARVFELVRARSPLYRSQILRVDV